MGEVEQQLNDKIEDLEDENTTLREVRDDLMDENERLRKENEELKNKLSYKLEEEVN